MNYLRSFLEEKKRTDTCRPTPDKTDDTVSVSINKCQPPTDKIDRTPSVSFVSTSLARVNTAESPEIDVKEDHERAEIDRIARMDWERTERDRLAKRGYDFDKTAPSPSEFQPADWRRHGPFNSRSPLIPPAIRVKIETIEAEARALGWDPGRLWNANFWDSPRGLAAILDEGDEIGKVTADYIEILKSKRTVGRFYRQH